MLNFNDYMKACTDHLDAKVEVPGDPDKYYYEEKDPTSVASVMIPIRHFLEKGVEDGIITEDQYNDILQFGKNPGKFYCIFKIHKHHEPGTTPPERPIVSGAGSFIENISQYVEHYIKQLATKHKSYLKDTPDFLRHIKKYNETEVIPPNTILVTMDVSAMYTNIPHSDGIEATREALEGEMSDKHHGICSSTLDSFT